MYGVITMGPAGYELTGAPLVDGEELELEGGQEVRAFFGMLVGEQDKAAGEIGERAADETRKRTVADEIGERTVTVERPLPLILSADGGEWVALLCDQRERIDEAVPFALADLDAVVAAG